MKKCSTCKQEKELSEFAFLNKEAGKLHARCKSCLRKIYQEKYRDNRQFREEKKAMNREKDKRNAGSIYERYRSLKNVTGREDVNLMISKEQLEEILNTKYCYITGIKLSDHLPTTTTAYCLDRIGLKEHGGNGIKGGDYCLENVLPCIYKFNEAREILEFTPEQMKALFLPIRSYNKAKNRINKIKNFFKKYI